MAIRVDAILGADVGGYVSGMARASQASQQFAMAANSSNRSTAAGFQQLQASVNSIQGNLIKLKTNATRAFAAIGAAQIIPSVFSAAKTALIDFNQQMDQSRIAFTTFMGSADSANKMLLKLQDFAAKTPFNFKDLLGTTQQMIAMGTAAEDLIPRLTAIGDAAAALGGSPEVMRRIQRALGQIQAKGRVQAEELMQLAEVGIPAYEYIARTLGVTIPQALKMMEQGQVDAATAITGLLDGMGSSFGGMMDKHSQTMMGALSTVQDYVQMTVANMSRPLFEAVRNMMRSIANVLGSDEMRVKAENFATAVRNAFEQAGEVAVTIWRNVQPTIESIYKTVVSLGKTLANGWKAAQPVFTAVVGSIVMLAKVVKPVIDAIGTLADRLGKSKAAGIAVATALISKFTPLGGIIKKITEDVTRLTSQRATGDVFKIAFQGQQALVDGTKQASSAAGEMAGAYGRAMAQIGSTGVGAAKDMQTAYARAMMHIQGETVATGQQLTRMQALGKVAMNGITTSAKAMGTTFKTVLLSMKASMIAFAATIPLVLAITAITTAIGKMGKESRDAKKATEDLTGAIKNQIKAVYANKEAFEEFKNAGTTATTLVTNALKASAEAGEEAGVKLVESFAMFGRQVDAKLVLDLGDNFEATATKMLQLQGVSEDVAVAIAQAVNETDKSIGDMVQIDGELVELTQRQVDLANALEEIQDQIEHGQLTEAMREQKNYLLTSGELTQRQIDAAYAEAERTAGFAQMSDGMRELIVLQSLLNAATADYEAEIEAQRQRELYAAEITNAYKAQEMSVADLNEQYELLKKGQTDGKLTFEEFSGAIWGSVDAAGNWSRAMRSAQGEVRSAAEGLKDAGGSFEALDDAGYALEQQLRQVYFTGVQMGKDTPTIAQEMNKLVGTFVNAAGEAEYADDAIRALLEGMVSLERFGSIGINLYTNADQVMAEIELVAEALARLAVIGGAGDTSGLFKQLNDLRAILDEFNRRAPSGGGRGGGGGRAEDDGMAALAEYVKNVEDYVAKFFERNFARDMIERSSRDIADAMAALLDEGIALGLDQIEGAPAIFEKINKKIADLVNMADDLNRPETGLIDRLAALDSEIRSLDQSIKGMTERFRDFQRVEQGIGEATTQERLEEQLDLFRQMKSELNGLIQEYERFKTGGKTAISEQLSLLSSLESNLNGLLGQVDDINRRLTGATGLEREVEILYELSDAYDRAVQSRADYAKNTAESLGTMEFAKRGGALFTAQRYLQKVTAFRDILASLRDRAFPPEMIREVISAGLDGGTAIGRKLLALSDIDLAEFKRVQEQITAIATDAGQIAADVLFTADVQAADRAFQRQYGLIQQLYQSAIAQAQQEFAAQQAIVDAMYQAQIAEAQAAFDAQTAVVQGLFEQVLAEMRAELEGMNQERAILVTAIDDLKGAMYDLVVEIGRLVESLVKPAAPSGGGASGGGVAANPIFTAPDYLVGGQPGEVSTVPGGLTGGSPTGANGWTGLGFDASGGGYLRSPSGETFYLEPGIDFGALGRRAFGGSVSAGSAYMVGELGPELFLPGRSGTIVPNNAIGGGTKNYTINVNIAGGQNIGREVVRAIEDYERRNGAGWRS